MLQLIPRFTVFSNLITLPGYYTKAKPNITAEGYGPAVGRCGCYCCFKTAVNSLMTSPQPIVVNTHSLAHKIINSWLEIQLCYWHICCCRFLHPLSQQSLTTIENNLARKLVRRVHTIFCFVLKIASAILFVSFLFGWKAF